MEAIKNIVAKKKLQKPDIVNLLETRGSEMDYLLAAAGKVKQRTVGNKVYFRGLVEFSNICEKNCLYCGIRKDNSKAQRYNLSDVQILDAAKYAYNHNYASLVLQSGEIESEAFTLRVENLLKQIKKLSNNRLGITLSVGEQNPDTYQRWFDAGAHRYLLRIETSNEDLYKKIHPHSHRFDRRYKCLLTLQKIAYQVGTGVMIGLPFQSIEHLADDLLFMKNFDIDMVGMGPYIEHCDTPLFQHKNQLWPLNIRFEMALKMIAVLRLLMPDINIAAATALQAIDPMGREKAILAGANVVMPNITPDHYRNMYYLYSNKPCTDTDSGINQNKPDALLKIDEKKIGYGEWGDSKHYFHRINKIDTNNGK
jgi:biotin synthase